MMKVNVGSIFDQHAAEAYGRMMEIQLHIFLISALHRSNWPALHPCSFTFGEEPQ
jgi:hypothetical protein